MIPRLTGLVALLILVSASHAVAAAPPAPVTRVTIELLSETVTIPAGQTFWVGLRQRIAPGWHTYWINPGDSGEPLRIEWALPDGFSAGQIAWPHPERIPVGPAMSFGYSDEIVLPIPLTAPRDLAPGTRVTLRARARWVVCEKICIPEESTATLTLPVASGVPPPHPAGAAAIGAARRAVPTASPWPASFVVTPETVTLAIAATQLAADRITDVWFYPARWGAIEYAAPQSVQIDERGITLEMARGPLAEAATQPIDGVLVVTERLDRGIARQAFTIRAPPRGAGAPNLPLLHAIALAFAGGLILNLMPCVLPILSVKALALVHHGRGSRAELRRHGAAYAAGVLASFAALAGGLIALRAGGEQIGWGFQLQSPAFVTLLAFVLFTMALALTGVIHLGTSWTGAGHALAARAGYGGSFFTGALATVAATPCTAPFMGVAIGFAMTQPWPTALAVFEALGAGLATPYVLLTLVPAWRRLLPRPGPWMERLKQLLAFPLYASVAWLVWVVSQQAGPQGVAAAGAGLVLIAFAAWLHGVTARAQVRWRRAASASVAALGIGVVALGGLAGAGPSALSRGTTSSGGWERFSEERLRAVRAEGKPVLVNVTAAWCITCLVNERVALTSPAVAAAVAQKGVVRMKADWTNRDPAITRVLASFGRNGVPLYVLYPPGGATEPAVLPQILTEGIVVDAIEKL